MGGITGGMMDWEGLRVTLKKTTGLDSNPNLIAL
jgi:hypothetical protein